jgi:hypothetical protein
MVSVRLLEREICLLAVHRLRLFVLAKEKAEALRVT